MAKNLTKKNIVQTIHEKIHETHKEIGQNQIQEIVQLTMETIGNALREGRNVELRNFGVFEVQRRKSRIGRNPNRPEKDVIIPARAVIRFKAGKDLKEKMKAIDLSTISPQS